MRNKLTILFLFFLITYEAISQQYIPKSRTFGITAKVIDSPLSVEFTWDANLPVADGIKIRKKLKGEKKWGSYIIIDKSATSYTDKSVVQGKVYEYEIIRDIPDELDDAFQYLAVAINTPIVDYRGKILLLIESSVASAIKAKTDRLALDMICDGWQVIKKEFSRSTSVPVVKAWIKSEYNKDTSNVKSVFLLGNVPIPFSSSYAPDGHVLKAYPADGYYGDMDGIWTDSSVNYVSPVKPIYSNIPGDGKFDQVRFPSDVDLHVGRVDFSNVPRFKDYDKSMDETGLLNRYLDKDHDYRTRLVNFPKRGLIEDQAKTVEMFSFTSWGSLYTLLGRENVFEKDFYDSRNDGYLWANASGSGSYTTVGTIVSSEDFASSYVSYNYAFLFMFGSWFVDWSYANSLMTAALGSKGNILTAVWSGRPCWWFHPLGSGETFGYCAKMNQNNWFYWISPPPYQWDYNANAEYRGVWMELLGDPTLRMYMIAPPTHLTSAIVNNHVKLSWKASPDVVSGYHIYKATSLNDKFVRITGSVITDTSFTDPNTVSGNYIYQVKAIKKEINNSGSFYNSSRGVLISNIDTVKDSPIVFYLPRVANSIPDTTLAEGQKLFLNLNGVFKDDDSTDVLNYRLALQGKITLPAGWLFNSKTLSLTSSKPVPGIYTFVFGATDKQLFSVTDTFIITVKSINSQYLENMNNQKFCLYPNPAQGIVNLLLPDNFTGIMKIQIIDMYGKPVQMISAVPDKQMIQLDLIGLSKGFYLLVIESSKYTEKLPLLLQ